MVDHAGTARIIDFGAVWVAGVADRTLVGPSEVLGTAQYTAPEYFVGDGGSDRSDLYSLAVIVYQMLTGRLPYGAQVAQVRTRADQRALRYRSSLDAQRALPAWVDEVLRKALHPLPGKRHEALSEFIHDLSRPGPELLRVRRTPLIERDPVVFWKVVALVLAILLVALASQSGLS
jgi:serine/threonine protein kinase